MRLIRYQVACSLDGYIEGPNGEYDWIVMDPEIDFNAIFSQFDTLLMGRRTFEVTGVPSPGMKVVVFSRTLRQEDHPGVTIVSDNPGETVDALRRRSEERRVGKECRSRWTGYHDKKKERGYDR